MKKRVSIVQLMPLDASEKVEETIKVAFLPTGVWYNLAILGGLVYVILFILTLIDKNFIETCRLGKEEREIYRQSDELILMLEEIVAFPLVRGLLGFQFLQALYFSKRKREQLY